MKTREIAALISGELVGDGEVEIERVASLERASVGDIAFVETAKGEPETGAACLIVPLDFAGPKSIPLIKVVKPKLAFAQLARNLHPHDRQTGWHDTARIAAGSDVRASYLGPYVSVGEGTDIGEASEIHTGVKIGNRVRIGKCCVIHANSVIYDNVSIGHDCIIHAGAVIGADGFGYVQDAKGEHHKFPQIGTVVIEDRVEIGANTCVDRGALGETRIGEGTKIDNLVQIAHNVQIGKRVIIAAQTGISGSTVIEDDCVIGGQVGMGDHARVKSGAVIGSQAGVLPGKIVRPGVWWGTPVQPLDEYKRQNAHLKGLARLKDEIRELKRQLAELLAR